MVVGGGLAGMAAAVALGSAGFEVDLHESRPFLGGRATSFPLDSADPDSERIDNCQHVLLRCFTNLLDFYERVGVSGKIAFHDRFYFVRPGGAVDVLKRGLLPAPLHLAGSLLRFGALDAADKWSVIRGLGKLKRDAGRPDLEAITMSDWLRSVGTTETALRRFWQPILVSALNEELDRAAALWGFQVFLDGMMAGPASYEMGIPAVPLAELYSSAGSLGKNVHVHLRSAVEQIDPAGNAADFYVCAAPFERVADLVPGLGLQLDKFEHSPITGIHLWYDRAITSLPHAVLLDRTLQWVFRKSETYVQAVVSASRSLTTLPRAEIVELACNELREFFPASREAKLVRSHVIKEMRATFSSRPGLLSQRPDPATIYPNLFLAGDWTNTGWPPTMEGAVRSGYRAAENVCRAAGNEMSFLC
jgi:zeta-carotene desaturase